MANINQQHSQSDSPTPLSHLAGENPPILNRIPRIHNLTNLSLKYQKEPIQANYKKIINLITLHYTNNGFTYLTQSLSLDQLQEHCISISIEDFQEAFIQQSSIYTKFLNPADSDAFSGTIRTLLVGTLTAHSLSSHRATKLFKSLEPYISYESGKPNIAVIRTYLGTLDMDVKIQKQLLEIISLLAPKTTTQVNILNMGLQDSGSSKADMLSKDEAINLIQDRSQALLTEPQNLEAIYAEHEIALSPSVTAIAGQEKGPLAIGPGNSMVSEEIILDID